MSTSASGNEAGGGPGAAVDGDSKCSSSSVPNFFESSHGINPTWWMVDLGAPTALGSVVITGLTEFWSSESDNLELRVGNSSADGGTGNAVCAAGINAGANSVVKVACDSLVGRYVTINRMSADYLALCEVAIYGKGEWAWSIATCRLILWSCITDCRRIMMTRLFLCVVYTLSILCLHKPCTSQLLLLPTTLYPTDIQLCEAGTFSSTGGPLCSACPAGSSSALAAMSCDQCQAGRYADASGSSACSACASGSYSPITGLTTCSACAAGSSSSIGVSSCYQCSRGRYSTAAGQTACSDCPVGKTTPAEGATNETACVPCKLLES